MKEYEPNTMDLQPILPIANRERATNLASQEVLKKTEEIKGTEECDD